MVIPLYNKAATFTETLRSVLNQDFHNFEVVIVDDGSTDGSAHIVDSYLGDPRIRIVRQANVGECGARNAGIFAAKYELIAFLDADDQWLPGYLSEMKEAIEEFPDAGMYLCGGIVRYPDDSGFLRFDSRYRDRVQSVDYFQSPYFFGNSSAVVIRKSCFSQSGVFPAGMVQRGELVLFFRLALLFGVVFSPALLTVYNKGVVGQATEDRDENMKAVAECVNRTYSFWSNLDADKKDPLLLDVLLADWRSAIRHFLLHKNHSMVRFLFEETDGRFLSELHWLERTLYPRPAFRSESIVLTRVFARIRRLHRFPAPRYCRRIPIDYLPA